MTFFLLILNFLWMLIIPLLLAAYLSRRLRANWGLFGIGAATFILSQIGHLPFNWLILQRWQLLTVDTSTWGGLLLISAFLGLSAGLFEETARYLTYRFWAQDARTWRDGLMTGAGHGGIEAMLLGILGLVNLVLLNEMRQGDLTSMVTAEQWPIVQAQIANLFDTPWYMTWVGALERVFAVTFHLAASCLVLQAVVHGRPRYYLAAVAWHTLLNGLALVALSRWGIWASEGALALMTVGSVWIIWRARPLLTSPPEPPPAPLPAVPVTIKPVTLDGEALDKSRYS